MQEELIKNTELKTKSSSRQIEPLVSLQPYYVDDNAILFCGASEKVLPLIPANSVDLTVTSPPYDNLRNYLLDKFVIWGYIVDEETKNAVIEELIKHGIKPVITPE